MTFHDKYDRAMHITDPGQAAQYFEECVQHQILCAREKGQILNLGEAQEIERQNIGYWAGYYSRETRLRVEELFGCEHPVLGKAKDKDWSPEELLHKGMEVGRQYNERLERGSN